MKRVRVIHSPAGINNVNMVWSNEKGVYTVESDSNVATLRLLDKIIPEKSRSQGKLHVYFYIPKIGKSVE